MKAISLLLASGLAFTTLPAAGSPAADFSQVIIGGSESFRTFANGKAPSMPNFATADLLSDAKKAILKGKHNMQKWLHQGKEFIKQNGLLCECLGFKHRFRTNWNQPKLKTDSLIRRACFHPSFFRASAQSYRTQSLRLFC